MNGSRVLVMVLAACGAAPPPPTVAPPEPAPARTRVPCPDATRVQQIADEAWHHARGEYDPPTCGTFVRGGEAFWIIAGYTNGPPPTGDERPMALRRLLLVTPMGAVAWSNDEEWETFEVERYHEGNFRGVDLDGDGDDEVLHDATSDHDGMLATQLRVAKPGDAELTTIDGDGILLSQVDFADEDGGCDGDLTFLPAGKGQQIHVAYTGADCAEPSVTFELRAGTLVERGADATK